jgi:hypothetical protein
LGLGNHALTVIESIAHDAQVLPQGFFTEGTVLSQPIYPANRWTVNTPSIIRDGKRTNVHAQLSSDWFDMPSLEGGGELMTTFNEMLLQSHDGIIRVFPSLPEGWMEAKFKLRAVGAFVITAARKAGAVQPLWVESLKGGTCRLENPWPQKQVSIRDIASGRLLTVKADTDQAVFECDAGSIYLVFPAGQAESEPEPPQPRHAANHTPKQWGGNRIGMERFF